MQLSRPLTPILALLLASGAFAQGDDCSTAASLTGTGPWSFDTSSNTTSGFNGGGSCGGGADSINQDLFWQWTAPANGTYVFDTFGSLYDTKLSAHTGTGCSATCAAYNDDSGGGLQSQISLSGLSMGDSVLIQIGGYGSLSGTGTLNITAYTSTVPNDDCNAASPISGLGSFPFSTLGALSSGFDGGGACGSGSNSVNQDVFFQWTAPAAGDYVFDTFGVAWDTKLSVHTGVGCTASCGAYNDDTNGLQSEVILLGLQAGDPVLIQVGGYGSSEGTGSFNIASYVDPCATAVDDTYEDNDDCANASPIGDGSLTGLFVSQSDKDHYATCVGPGSTLVVDLSFTHANGDLDLFVWDAQDIFCGTGNHTTSTTALAYSYSSSDSEIVAWTNTSGSNMDVIIEVNVYAFSASHCNTYDLTLTGTGCGPPPVGTPFCDPATSNSTGNPAILSGNWGSGVGSDLHLDMAGGVPGQLAYMLVGNEATTGFVVPGSNGPLCLIGTPTAAFYRYNVAGSEMNSIGGFDTSGNWINAAGTATSTGGFGFDVPSLIPGTVPFAILAGDTWYFQGWYRDTPSGVGRSNFSNGFGVTF
ncbi:MAG: hypothetical protein KDB61_02085 [Planctomycetes bacterium]|nr:hypothetical protein [Planctomycetota bacterium]